MNQSCYIKKDILFSDLFSLPEEYQRVNTTCSLGISHDQKYFALKNLDGTFEDFDTVKVYNQNLQVISSFYCGNGGERGIVFWPDNEHVLTGGFARNNQPDEYHKTDGLKLYDIHDPRTYTNPLLDLDIKEAQNINCNVELCSSDGQYILIRNNNQILIDTKNKLSWRVDFMCPPLAFTKGNKYMITAYSHRLDQHNIYSVADRTIFHEGNGSFYAYNPSTDTYYIRTSIMTENWKHEHFLQEQTLLGEAIRRIDFDCTAAAIAVSLDNHWMAFGQYNGGLTVVNLDDTTEIYCYTEEVSSSPFQGKYPEMVSFLGDSRLVVAHYWGLGLRIYSF